MKNAAGLSSAAEYVKVTAGHLHRRHRWQVRHLPRQVHRRVGQDGPRHALLPRTGQPGGRPCGRQARAAGYITHYSETCARCHTTGYYPAPYNGSGGYWDAKAKASWTFPTWKLIDGAFAKANPSNWDAAPAAVKNMGTIGCEVCHGPATEHVKNGAKVRKHPFDDGVCNQCHGAAANHSKGWQLANSQAQHAARASRRSMAPRARPACAATAPRASPPSWPIPRTSRRGATRKAPSAARPATIRTPTRMPSSCALSASRLRSRSSSRRTSASRPSASPATTAA